MAHNPYSGKTSYDRWQENQLRKQELVASIDENEKRMNELDAIIAMNLMRLRNYQRL